MREVISLCIGQAGVQLGNICWELYCLEHGLDNKGCIAEKYQEDDAVQDRLSDSTNNETDGGRPETANLSKKSPSRELIDNQGNEYCPNGFDCFFMEMTNGNYSPRNLMIDLEPTVIDSVRTGKHKELYTPYTLISAKEDAANNYARGYYVQGSLKEMVMDPVRRMTESCDKLQGFMSFHSIGGGTGSGFHAALAQEINQAYPKTSKLEVAIFPSPTLSTAVVEPYNAVLTIHHTMNTSDCIFLADNEAMYNICQKKLGIEDPTYVTLNRLLAQTVSSMTASLRFKGTLNADFNDFQTNLVPYPRIHFPVVSYAPISSNSRETRSVYDITSSCFEYTNRLVKCENEIGRYISCFLLYRGDITPIDANQAIAKIKQKKDLQFVQWSPTGFKVGINGKAPAIDPDGSMAGATKACCMLSNTTAIKEAWISLNCKYHLMLSKQAFLHWYYREGMEDSEFYEAQEDLLVLKQDYEDLAKE